MKIGNYETVRLLGKGGMSEVYEAENPRLGSRHAIKLFTYEKDDADVRRRFETEGRLLARLNHPGIVRVTDLGTDAASGRPYFVMDLVLNQDGQTESLADVRPGMVDEETVGRWYDDLRESLRYIHACGVIHRDLKLQNVLIGPDGRAVLTDFGISKIFDATGEGKTVVDTVNTIVKMRDGRNLVMGSLGYMAPELEMGVEASPQSDWYALGVIVYRLLTGTWCDARTDLVANLETYDPVWKRILPRLLHANPQGRECLSYADEKRTAREQAEFAAEERWLKEKARGHLARHLARYAAAAVALLAVALTVALVKWQGERELWALRLKQPGAGLAVPGFNDLFRIPAEARGEEQRDENGEVTMPSRAQFEAARLDALVLFHPLMFSLEAGDVTLEHAIETLEGARNRLVDAEGDSPLDNLNFGDASYLQLGEDEPLVMLVDAAVERLRELAEL